MYFALRNSHELLEIGDKNFDLTLNVLQRLMFWMFATQLFERLCNFRKHILTVRSRQLGMALWIVHLTSKFLPCIIRFLVNWYVMSHCYGRLPLWAYQAYPTPLPPPPRGLKFLWLKAPIKHSLLKLCLCGIVALTMQTKYNSMQGGPERKDCHSSKETPCSHVL